VQERKLQSTLISVLFVHHLETLRQVQIDFNFL
jgi:hypothetical protein